MPLQALSKAEDSLRRISLVASDMDGTMTTEGRFSAELFRAFENIRKSGVRIVLVTGRSAGWVNGLVSLLPIDGAIAENGGLYFPANEESHGIELIKLRGSRAEHKKALRAMFEILKAEFPEISEAPDNAYRVTDWTFSVHGLSEAALTRMRELCNTNGWDFTYSNVQCHIMLKGQDKAQGLIRVTNSEPNLKAGQHEVLTIGDSPNDESFFNPTLFPCSVGVANILKYQSCLKHLPAFVTQNAETAGFCEMATALVKARK